MNDTRGCGCRGEGCVVPKGDERHGESGTYRNYGCRCARCTRAWTKYYNTWLHKSPERYERIKAQRRQRYYQRKNEQRKVAA